MNENKIFVNMLRGGSIIIIKIEKNGLKRDVLVNINTIFLLRERTQPSGWLLSEWIFYLKLIVTPSWAQYFFLTIKIFFFSNYEINLLQHDKMTIYCGSLENTCHVMISIKKAGIKILNKYSNMVFLNIQSFLYDLKWHINI